jgi:regulatory protein
MDAAVKYLSARERSRKETEQKLAQAGYCREAVETVIEKLAEYGYLDDERYARRLVEQKQSGSKPYGKKAVVQKLKQRGIGGELAHLVLLETDESTERENALSYAKKLWPKYPDKTREKVSQRLATKGFDYDTIRYVLRVMDQTD